MTDLTPNDLSDEEFNALCPQGEHAPGPEPLSPAAQKVLDAFSNASDGEYIDGVWVVSERTMLSAAICELADQVVPKPIRLPRNSYAEGAYDQRINDRQQLLAIATELENQ
jgi:hypothetical protein